MEFNTSSIYKQSVLEFSNKGAILKKKKKGFDGKKRLYKVKVLIIQERQDMRMYLD